MANHEIPRRARQVEELTAPGADGVTVRCRVYEHTRQGHGRPMFYVVQYRLTAAGRIDRDTRVTNQISGPDARARLDAEMTETRRLFAEANLRSQP
jgi:hypothetical protein